MTKALRVVIIDDASTYRRIMNIVIGDLKGVECIGEFADGLSGLVGIEELQPDIIFLDIEMPLMSGIDVLQEVKRRFPHIGVIIVSGFDKKQADITIKALEMGAIDFVPKPDRPSVAENIEVLKKKIGPLLHVFLTKKNLEKVKELTGKTTSDSKPKQQVEKKEKFITAPFHIDLVVIGTSTGGPYALTELIPKLPNDFPVPILIVQHMPPNFTSSLANSLTKKSKLPVYEGRFGDVVAPGKIMIAPGGYHMVVKNNSEKKGKITIDITDTPSVHGCKPSVDVLFKSIANNFEGNILAVIMTGMGSDGADGVRALKQKKCYCLIQDEESCVVFGMPKAVMQSKLSDEIVPLNNLAKRITDLVRYSR